MSVKFGPQGQCAHGLYNGCRACGEKPGERSPVVAKRKRVAWNRRVCVCGHVAHQHWHTAYRTCRTSGRCPSREFGDCGKCIMCDRFRPAKVKRGR